MEGVEGVSHPPQALALVGCLMPLRGLGNRWRERRTQRAMKGRPLKVGAVGAVDKPFTFSTRDLQQQIKGQSWIADGGGVDALKAALLKLEKWLWIYTDEGDERWKPRTDLLDRRW